MAATPLFELDRREMSLTAMSSATHEPDLRGPGRRPRPSSARSNTCGASAASMARGSPHAGADRRRRPGHQLERQAVRHPDACGRLVDRSLSVPREPLQRARRRASRRRVHDHRWLGVAGCPLAVRGLARRRLNIDDVLERQRAGTLESRHQDGARHGAQRRAASAQGPIAMRVRGGSKRGRLDWVRAGGSCTIRRRSFPTLHHGRWAARRRDLRPAPRSRRSAVGRYSPVVALRAWTIRRRRVLGSSCIRPSRDCRVTRSRR